MATLAEASAASRALYRSLLRTARRMPDDHRTSFVLNKVRSDFDKQRSATSLDVIVALQVQGEVYRDQLEHQAEHLSRLAQQATLIPVDLRLPRAPPPSTASSSRSGPSRPSRPNRPSRPPPSLELTPTSTSTLPLDRRKLVRAIAARRESDKTAARGGVASLRRDRFMDGPEPSWIRKKHEHEHGTGCGCASRSGTGSAAGAG
ncbi:hypothetical protein JCM8208_001427 [Rhodotorula glutinis]